MRRRKMVSPNGRSGKCTAVDSAGLLKILQWSAGAGIKRNRMKA
jgi:hypothetical protein